VSAAPPAAGADVAIVAEHGEVLAHWARLRYCGETVLSFDRHLDLKVLPPVQLRRIEAAAADSDALAALDRDLPFRDDDRFAYGLDSWLYPAVHLGLCRRLIWVVPEPVPVPASALARILWDQLSLLPGHADEVEATFAAGDLSCRAEVGGTIVEVTTLLRLSGLAPRESWRVDIDLDFFCDDAGRPTHAAAAVAATLRELGLAGRLDAVTRSVSSGFLPRELATLAEELAGRLGRRVTFGPTRIGAANSLAALAGFVPLDGDRLRVLAAIELDGLGGPGHGLRALLALRLGDQLQAEASFDRARELGDRADWAAYGLGLARLGERDHAGARMWFARMVGPLTDPLRLRGLLAEALCAQRSGAFDDALKLATVYCELVPLRPEGWRIAGAAARALGRADQGRSLDEQAAARARLAPE
jgi:hypothetical protein